MGRFTIHFRSFAYNFTQVKVKEVGMPQSELYILKKLSFSFENALEKLALL